MSERSAALNAMPWSSLVRGVRTYALFTLDATGVIDSWNEGVRELLGYEEHEFVGQHTSIIFTLEDRSKRAPEREMAQARETGEAMDDRWHLRKDGSRLWVNGIMYCVKGDAGRPVGFLKIMRDQTDDLATSARLVESEERFAKAFRGNPTPIAILALVPSARIIDVNEAFTRAFRLERHEAIGLSLGEIGVDQGEGLDGAGDELRRGRSAGFEAPFRRGDGAQGHGTFAFEPIDLGGEPHAVMLMHDVTEWRRTHAQLEQQHEFVSAILNSLPGIFYLLDSKRRLVDWNEEFERVLGLGTDELTDGSAEEAVVEAEAFRQNVATALRTGHAAMEGHLRTAGGEQVPYLLTGRRILRNGRPFVLGVGVEVSEQVRARRFLERQAREQAAFADLTALALSAEDLQPVLGLGARRVAETLGAERVLIVEFVEGEAVVRVDFQGAGAAPGAAAPLEVARMGRDQNGAYSSDASHWPAEVLAPLGLRSGIRARIQGRGQPFGFIEALSERDDAFSEEDVSFLRSVAYLLAGGVEQVRLVQELAHRANHDDLTGLLTRVAFEHRLVEALARAARSKTKVAALFLDLDRFKNINDSLGHQAGDEVLRNVALRLRDAVRSWDVIARHGGDEFVLFLPDIESSAEIAHVTARILEEFEAPFTVAGRELQVGVTVGVASFPDDGEDAETLLRAADTALYEGKARGRNSFHFFTQAQNERVMARLELELDLRQAVGRDEFALVYQPQVDLADGVVRVVEALLRWRRPERGHLPPNVFLPVAEAIGLAVPIGEWTLKRAFADHAGWRGRPGAPERVAVNVSPAQFLQPSFPDALLALAAAHEVAPREVEIEVAEGALLKDPELVASHLSALQAGGFGVVLDDFGTSATPIAGLQSLPFSRLKLDETFTHRLADEQGRRLAKALVQLARSLGFEPVAAGIETGEQHEAARALGFGAAQGSHYAHARASAELLAWLGARGR